MESKTSNANTYMAFLDDQVNRLHAKVAGLRRRLRVFGVHLDDCSYFDKEIATCNCGLEEALRE